MEIRNVGKSGLRVSLVGLGCNNFGSRLDAAATRRVVDSAIDAGITLFDTADSYGNRGGSETQLGEALGDRRKEIVLATKFSSPMNDAQTMKGASRRYIMSAVEASLVRLKTDWIDLYQMHWPDPLTPIEETLRALDDLVRQGKVRYIGSSNLSGWQITDAAWTARHHGLAPFVSAQNEFSMLVRDQSQPLLPVLDAFGVSLLPYYPLASGLLTGKYQRDKPLPPGRLQTVKMWAERFLTERNWRLVTKLAHFAEERGQTLIALAFGWLASHPQVASVIAGATTPEQIAANVAAAAWRLSPEDRAAVDSLLDDTN
jgi:aryl-alcohol dehydrogenase-like predicted oxidoreductase